MNPYQVIRGPVITEKATVQKGANNQLTFKVDRKANRVEIRHAVEKVFNVRVVRVRTVQVKGKVKRVGRVLGKRCDWKKAIVTLAQGENITFFEGV